MSNEKRDRREETFKETYKGESTVTDKHFVTGKGAGVSLKFAFELLNYQKTSMMGTEMWLSILYMLCDYANVSDELK